VLIGVLLISLIPLTGGVSPENVSLSTRANELLLTLDRLANYTHEVGCDSSEAEVLRERAWKLYRAGEYNESVREALKAMKLYHSTVSLCQSEEEPSVEKTNWSSIARVELAIAENVLEYARELIDSGELGGEELMEIEAEYNQTLSAYNAVKTSLEENDTQDIGHKVAFLQSSRRELEQAVNQAVKNSVRKNAEVFGRTQLQKINLLISSGFNSTELLSLRDELENAIKSGDSGEILRLLRKASRIMMEMEKRGKLRGVTHTTPERPSSHGNSMENSTSTSSKRNHRGSTGDRK